ncbi:MAG: hypothetical protein BWY99_02509 [Synergistetes bacterium ADurb.BinA166]|nr:MAG: hypothetical protein BWY99_02509 [Synergistetes bacterium ADurb.BinA166]
MIQVVDYVLLLSTGERITVVELDPARISGLSDPGVLRAAAGVLRRCTFAPRRALEDAKSRYDKELLTLLRRPDGRVRSERPVCRLIGECAMADPGRCTLVNLKVKKDATPGCWEYGPPEEIPPLSEEVRRAALEIGTAVGHAWLSGAYPVVVDLTPAALGSSPR